MQAKKQKKKENRKMPEDIVNFPLHWLSAPLHRDFRPYSQTIYHPYSHIRVDMATVCVCVCGEAIVPTINHAHFSATEPQPYNITLHFHCQFPSALFLHFPSALSQLAAHFSNASIHFSWRSSYIFYVYCMQLLLCFSGTTFYDWFTVSRAPSTGGLGSFYFG